MILHRRKSAGKEDFGGVKQECFALSSLVKSPHQVVTWKQALSHPPETKRKVCKILQAKVLGGGGDTEKEKGKVEKD